MRDRVGYDGWGGEGREMLGLWGGLRLADEQEGDIVPRWRAGRR